MGIHAGVLLGVVLGGVLLQACAADSARPVVLRSDDVNVLMADRSEPSIGHDFTVWGKPEGRAWVEGWNSPDQAFKWTVTAPSAGDYRAFVLVEGKRGDRLKLSSISGDLVFGLALDGWDKIAAPGDLRVPKGASEISIRLIGQANLKLKSVELVRSLDLPKLEQRIRRFRSDTTWLKDAKYGLMFQWGEWGYPQRGEKKKWPAMVDDFDVDKFADTVVETAAGYVVWSATWRTYYFPAPIKAIDKILPGRTSRRDLIGDLADALSKRKIKLMLYYHEGHPDQEWWSRNWVSTDDKTRFEDNLVSILTEVGNRYRGKLAGWMFDDGMLFYPASFEQIGKAAKIGNPARLISYNPWVLPRLTEFQDFYFGEGFTGSNDTRVGSSGRIPAGPQAGLQDFGSFILDGPDWGVYRPDTVINKPAYTSEQAVDLVRRASERGQALTFDMLMYEDGSVSPDSLAVMVAVRKAIRGKQDAGLRFGVTTHPERTCMNVEN